MDEQRLLQGLDTSQRAAVKSSAPLLAILAGAGSGKTRVLTRRIAYRCVTGEADARHVLAVTFTRKAANELDTRLRSLGLRDLPATGTFHGLAYAQLRMAWAAAGTAPPKLLDRKGPTLTRVLGNTKRVRARDLATEIEWAKARLVTPDGYADAVHRADRRPPAPAERVAEWFRSYEQTKRKRGTIDFDDLLARCVDTIERNPSFAAAQRWRFRHLFVDEYQDVNPLQERLLRAWLGDRQDLCVVGDPNQAIYGWNGADASFLEDFSRHHPGAEVVALTDSYRSTPQILDAAAAVLARNGDGPRPLHAHRADGLAPTVTGYASDTDEATAIARAARDRHQPGQPWSAQAVLMRTNAQAPLIEEAFRRAGIPYRVRGASEFLSNPDVVDLLRRLDRLSEPLAVTIGDLEVSITRDRAVLLGLEDEHGVPIESPDGLPSEVELPDSAAGRRIEAFAQIVRLGRELIGNEPTTPTDALSGWLRTVLLDDGPAAADAVTISSFHAAKGLEWDVVHLAGIEAGYVPISHAKTPEAHREEERLFYVAITRAAEELRCTWAATRTFGVDPVERKPSPFLQRIRASAAAQPHLEPSPDRVAGALTHSRAALGEAASPPATDGRATDLAAALRRWRTDQARKAAAAPTVVLSDRALDAIARRRPTTADELAAIPGLGASGRARHGPALLQLVGAHGPGRAGASSHTGRPSRR